ncbi:MAG TPA: Nif3-like dinuclear metal center hexameric protein [Oscillospiraceae bacterium]|nr:Nif3-like dinuclear metal center hexameric protein [Oscillospiraceae bacterium]
MTVTVGAIHTFLASLAPEELQMSFDNSGFLVGERVHPVHRVLVSLDITLPVAEEAVALGAELIVSHHPVIFDPVRRVTDESTTGKILLALIKNEVAAICMHTNLDAVRHGVNDVLAEAAGLSGVLQLHEDGLDSFGRPYGIGRVGELPGALEFEAYAAGIKAALGCGGLRCCDAGKPVRRVAVGSGSCGSMLEDAVRAGCDTFVTADVKYDVFLEAQARGINLIDAGHYPTEQPVMPRLADALRRRFPSVRVEETAVHRDDVRYL